jgi:hypothetical protein
VEILVNRARFGGVPRRVRFICWDCNGAVVVADEVDPGTAISLAVGWREQGFIVHIQEGLTPEHRGTLECANPPTTIHPSEYEPNPEFLKEGLSGTWMAPFGNRLASEFEKSIARNAHAYAVTHGKVERQTACQRCGVEDSAELAGRGYRILDAHHEDYSRPLDVVYLCRSCHRRRHRSRNQSVPIGEWLRRGANGTD